MNRVLVSASLLVAACCASATSAGAAPQNKPAAKPAGSKAQKAATSLAAIQAASADELKKSERAIKEKKLTAIESYLTANPAAPDRAKALAAACELALELDKWGKGRTHADAFVKAFPEHKDALAVRLNLARCLKHEPGQERLARETLAAVIADSETVNVAVTAGTELADLLADAGDIEGAKKVLDDIAEKHSSARGLKEFLKGKTADLELIGTEPKPIEAKGMDGKPISLADYKGKVLLIDFWATWCGPCVVEMPNVIDTYQKHHDRGFDILGISLDSDEQAVKDFLEEHGMTWRQHYDGGGWKNEIAVLYGVQSIPKTYLLDQEGKIRAMGLRGEALGRAVEKLLARSGGKAAPASGTKDTPKKE
jgi:peroxiredoxin